MTSMDQRFVLSKLNGVFMKTSKYITIVILFNAWLWRK